MKPGPIPITIHREKLWGWYLPARKASMKQTPLTDGSAPPRPEPVSQITGGTRTSNRPADRVY
jgi:hypothetical protein